MFTSPLIRFLLLLISTKRIPAIMKTAPIPKIQVIDSPKNIIAIMTEVIGTNVCIIPVSVAVRYCNNDNQKLYAKDVDRTAIINIRNPPRILIDIVLGGIRKAKKTRIIDPSNKLRNVTSKGFSSEKYLFRNTV